MDAALKTLRRYGITTSAAVARPGAPDGIAEQLAQRIRARFPFADGACVFWTADDDSRCFAPSGHLREPLTVHTYGPGAAAAAAAALEAVGLVVRSEGSSASAASVDTASDRAS